MPRRKKLTWPVALDAFEEHLLARGLSPATLRSYLPTLDRLRLHVAPRTPAQVSVADLRGYQVWLLTGGPKAQPLAPTTVQRISTTWRRFFGFLHAEGLVPSDPSARLENPKVPKAAPGEVLTNREVKRLLAAAHELTPKGLRDRAVVELLYATAIRRAELHALDLSDFNAAERLLTIRRGKGGKGRTLPVARSAASSLELYLREGRRGLSSSHPDSTRALFLAESGRRLSVDGVRRILARLREGACLKKAVTPHTLRRSCATALLKNGTSLRHIQQLLGHASLDTTAIYLRLDPSDLRRAILTKHPRERFEA